MNSSILDKIFMVGIMLLANILSYAINVDNTYIFNILKHITTYLYVSLRENKLKFMPLYRYNKNKIAPMSN